PAFRASASGDRPARRRADRRISSKPLPHSRPTVPHNMALIGATITELVLMMKVLGTVLAAIAITAIGFFGFEYYVQYRIAGDVEAAFATVRESGAKASHGKVSFDLWSRTITVSDIAGESAAQ